MSRGSCIASLYVPFHRNGNMYHWGRSLPRMWGRLFLPGWSPWMPCYPSSLKALNRYLPYVSVVFIPTYVPLTSLHHYFSHTSLHSLYNLLLLSLFFAMPLLLPPHFLPPSLLTSLLVRRICEKSFPFGLQVSNLE